MTVQPGKLSLGLPYLLETESIEAAVRLAKENKLSFVELNTNFPQCLLHSMTAEKLRELADKNDLFFTLHLDDSLNAADFNVHVREAYVKTALEAIDLCKAAGIPLINIHLAKGNIVTLPDGKHYIFEHFPDEFKRYLIDFRDRCERRIDGADLKICVENTDGWEKYEQLAIELLLESDSFGLTLDIGHDHAVRNQDLPFIKKHHKRLCHMHAHDGWGTTNHQALGSGEIPLHDRLAFARDQDATVVLEVKTVAALEASVAWINEQDAWRP